MITITDKKDCSGCAACRSACGHGCISMKADAEGFIYPEVDASKCVGCGLCDRACPIINVPQDNSVNSILAVKNRDEITRAESSSGGVFRLLAEEVLRRGGVVAGCILGDDMKARHAIARDNDELRGMLSSKYVQSDTTGIYEQVRQYLRDGVEVLFSGTPCHVAALRNFLRKKYDNLTTVDVLCHGVPSPQVLKEYQERLESRYKGKLTSLSFRCKDKSWKRLYIDARFDNGRRHFLYSGYDSYMQLFLSDRLQRPSCFNCPYNTLHRPGDISLGDFWGIGKKFPDFDDNKGISMVIINNGTGAAMWDEVKSLTDYFESDVDTATAGNKVLVQHLPSDKRRDEFYRAYVAAGYDAAIGKFAPEASKPYQWYYNFMRMGLDFVRKLKHESY